MKLRLFVAACSVLLSACTIGIVQMSDLTQVVSPLATPTLTASWQVVNVDDKAGMAGSMVLDRYDHPHFAYESEQFDLLHARWTGYAWEKEKINTMDFGGGVSLTLDSNDNPHIAFSACNLFACTSHYTRYTGHEWTMVELPFLAANVVVRVNATGTPHISYGIVGQPGVRQLDYAYRNESEWVTHTLAYEIEDTSSCLQLDREGNPHISYLGPSGLIYTYQTGREWRSWLVDDTWEVDVGYALALDKDGNAHLSYHESGEDKLRYAFWDGQRWTVQTIETAGNKISGYTAIVIDASGNPHIAYITEDGILKYAWREGSAWSSETVAAGVEYEYTDVSLVLDSLQQPHIGFHSSDGTNFSMVYAHKVAVQP
ncbi:MAG: hypothetical protein JXA21_05405 [Anaerolineae bacterium]|nr:hypothetical protein [Anaerolineae bacterium]